MLLGLFSGYVLLPTLVTDISMVSGTMLTGIELYQLLTNTGFSGNELTKKERSDLINSISLKTTMYSLSAIGEYIFREELRKADVF